MMDYRTFRLFSLLIREKKLYSTFSSRSVKPVARNKLVRVRFAPSPTGFLHLGGLRTALYNFLFAKSHGGQFVLRIEDTDQTRIVPGAVQQLEQDLNWAGIIPDESPSLEGSYGPYIQSERLHLYQGQAENLIHSGAAYRCFCTEKRLELLRKEALRQRQVPGYDNRCRHLTNEEIKEKMRNNTPYCIRFKLSRLNDPVPDLVYGSIDYEPADHEGDFVIVKQDGFPTYHLANVVDDHMMVITHVLRGLEWQVSTTKHVLLYRAFGWSSPQFAHLPLIMNPDGTKLSKRQGDIQVQNYKKQGIFPNALLNYVTKAGGGFSDQSLDQLFSLDQLIQKFDLSRMHSNSCRLTDRLLEYNRMELQQQISQPDSRMQHENQIIELVKSTFSQKSCELEVDRDHVSRVLQWSLSRIHRISDLVESDLAFLWLRPSTDSLTTAKLSPEILTSTRESLTNVSMENFNKENLKTLLRDLAPQLNIPFNKFMKILRSAISGLKEGPGVAEMMEILGSESTIRRLKHAEDILRKSTPS